MKWRKLGLVWGPDGASKWAKSHAMLPTPIIQSDGSIRVFVTCCDAGNVGRPGFVDISQDDPTRVLRESRDPVLDIGRPGTFDENGAAALSVVQVGESCLRMYFVGFELGTRIRYRLLTGLAESMDGGQTFKRIRCTPVLERSDAELYFRCGNHVVIEGKRHRMWYVAGSEWTEVNGKLMPVYVVKYLESSDGIDWEDEGRMCLDVSDADEHGFGRPWVRRTNAGYEMFLSVRRRSLGSYRLAYAVSDDGMNWRRRDHELGLDVSEQGFDSDAIMYSAVCSTRAGTFLFYNGNDFGRDGFAVAVLEAH